LMVVVAPHPWTMEGSRFTALHDATVARMRGEPLLTAVVSHGNAAVPTGTLTAADPSDDQRLMIFGPIAGDLLGPSDPTPVLLALARQRRGGSLPLLRLPGDPVRRRPAGAAGPRSPARGRGDRRARERQPRVLAPDVPRPGLSPEPLRDQVGRRARDRARAAH